MAINVLQAAKYLCKKSQWRLSNLELQKIIYICHVIYMGEKDCILIEGNFQAWKFGPVHPDLYEHLKCFGAAPIPETAFREVEDLNCITEVHHETADSSSQGNRDSSRLPECELLNKASESFPPGYGPQLVEATHWDKGAWKKNYIPHLKHIVIPDKDIKEEHKALCERY